MGKKINEMVLRIVHEERLLLKIFENRRARMFGRLLRHHSFLKSIIECKIETKKGRGRPTEKIFRSNTGKELV